jgi:lipase chaperone LimK
VLQALQSPEATQAVWQRVQALDARIAEPTVVLAIRNLSEVWKQLFAEEQQRIVRLLIERVNVMGDGIDIVWREAGWIELAGDLAPQTIGGELLEREEA